MRFLIDLKQNDPQAYTTIKKDLLIKAALSILEHSSYKNDLQKLRNIFKLSREEIIETYIGYNLDIAKNSNTKYQCLAMRYVLHMHNLLKGSWHIERQNTVSMLIREFTPSSIIDMGFGVPTQYVQEALQKNSPKITLCDIDDSAIIFAEALLDLWSHKDWRSQITFKKCDMNDGNVISKHNLYLFQDSIEHVEDCTNYLVKQVKYAAPNSYFLLSLPIGDITPEHYMEWKSEKAVYDWLILCGLRIINSKIVKVNPQVDLFADYHDFNYYGCFAICVKNDRKDESYTNENYI